MGPAAGKGALTPVWRRLRALLDVHAEAEERYFYPDVLKVGVGANDGKSADAETKDAIKDHNEIRDTAAESKGRGWVRRLVRRRRNAPGQHDHMSE